MFLLSGHLGPALRCRVRASPEPPRSTSDSNQRDYGEATVGPARGNVGLAQDVPIEETFFGGKGFELSPDDFTHPADCL